MGDAKKKSAQVFKLLLLGKQRHAIYQAFHVHNPKELEDRRRQVRASDALGLRDFRDLSPESDDAGHISIKALKEFNVMIKAKMDAEVTLTYENVEAILIAIKWCFEAGLHTPGATDTYTPIEDLMYECKHGLHQSPANETQKQHSHESGEEDDESR